ncbi:MAG: glycosyltransferase [Bacteroidales bacterium]
MRSQNGKIRVAFSVTNCICFDQRVLKMAGVVENIGAEITIIGRIKGDCCLKSNIPFKTRRFRMIFKKGFLFYKFINIRIFFYLLFHRFDLLVANDLDTLLPNFLVSKIKRIPLVYDSHEYFTGSPEISERRFVRFVWKTIEKMIVPYLKYFITVSDSIAKLYENEYGLKPVTIRNCAPLSDAIKPYEKQEIGIPEHDSLLIIQGTGINIDTGGEELIEALAETENVSLMIAGSGDMIPVLKEKAARLKKAGKVKFIIPMPWEELMRYTKSADAGMILTKDTNINYRFSLPNKLFDYLSAGIPVIASNLPEIMNIVTGFNCGIIIPEVTPEEIKEAIKMISGNRDLLDALRKNAVRASEELNWEKESGKASEFYNVIFKKEFKS